MSPQDTPEVAQQHFMKQPDAFESPGAPDEAISWTASEFIAHHKTASWYLMLAITAVVAAAGLYFLTKDIVPSAVVLLAALIFGIYGSKQPNQIEYRLTSRNLSIGNNSYAYADFRSFSIVPDHAFSSIVLMPLKRFAVPLTIYYDPQDEERIVSALSDKIPFEQQKPDAVDRLMRRVRF